MPSQVDSTDAFYFRDLFEAKNSSALIKLSYNQNSDLNVSPNDQLLLAQLLCHCDKMNLPQVFEAASKIISDSNSVIVRCLALHYAVAVTEIQYDRPLRDAWLKKWDQIAHWSKHSWPRFLRHFHAGLTALFDSQLQQAREYFLSAQKEAMQSDDNWAKANVFFHLGIVDLELNNLTAAKSLFFEAYQLAREFNYLRLLRRIAKIGEFTKSDLYFEDELDWIKQALKVNDLTRVRAFLLSAMKARRDEKRDWLSSELLLLLTQYLFIKNKMKCFHVAYTRLSDFNWRHQLLSQLVETQHQLPEHLIQELEWLAAHKGASPTTFASILNQKRLPEEVRKLLKCLMDIGEPISKENLCERLWQTSYDPFIHDSRLYKLVLKTRKLVGPQVLINTYGSYRIGQM